MTNNNHPDKNLEFARRLKKAVARSGLTWSQLAEKTGIPKSAMTAYKSGEYMPKQNNLYRIAVCLGVDPSWLLCIDDATEKVPGDNRGQDEQLIQQLVSLSDEQAQFVREFLALPEDQAQRVMDFLAGLKAAQRS